MSRSHYPTDDYLFDFNRISKDNFENREFVQILVEIL